LEKASIAVYGRNSFRGQELSFRDRHFNRDGELYSVKQSIRDCTKFKQANLLGDDFSLARGSYDFIFCRNLLIYFDRETQNRAFQKLESLLAAGGILFLGPAEVSLAMARGFSSINLPMAFACRRTAEATVSRQHGSPPTRLQAVKHVAVAPKPAASTKPAKPKAPPAAYPYGEALAAAREHADTGKMDEAIRLCKAHLDEHGPSVDAYYLLGVIQDALGHPDARDFYRKALYLAPDHCESLLQMAFLAEREGDSTAARNLRRRVQKQQVKTP